MVKAKGLTFAVGAIGGISLLVGAIGIVTIMTIAVNERINEIGLLRALGARQPQVLSLFQPRRTMAIYGRRKIT